MKQICLCFVFGELLTGTLRMTEISILYFSIPFLAIVVAIGAENPADTIEPAAPNGNVEVDFDTFVPYRDSRHDEFDWALSKVSTHELKWK